MRRIRFLKKKTKKNALFNDFFLKKRERKTKERVKGRNKGEATERKREKKEQKGVRIMMGHGLNETNANFKEKKEECIIQ